MEYVVKIAETDLCPILIKYHPNSIEIDKIHSNKVKIVKNIKNLPQNYNYIAFTFHSTYVYELISQMPFLCINPDMAISLEYFFPNEDSIYIKSYKDFENKLKLFLEEKNYCYTYWNTLIKMIKEITG